jgi:hypothetical protein
LQNAGIRSWNQGLVLTLERHFPSAARLAADKGLLKPEVYYIKFNAEIYSHNESG